METVIKSAIITKKKRIIFRSDFMQVPGNVQSSSFDEQTALKKRMEKVKHKIAIISGKGGVGEPLLRSI